MKRFIENNILGIIIGLSIAGIVVYAETLIGADEITYTPSNNNFNVTTVEGALNSLYSNYNNTLSLKKFCELKMGTALTVGAKYECDPEDGVKRNFYILAVNNNNTIDLIMEHNITEGTAKTTMTWNDAMKYIDNNNLKTSWSNVLDINLPSAQEIANAVGNTSWKVGEKNQNDWFYLDKNGDTYGQTQVANSTNKSNYAWLYNYTKECEDYGCNYSLSSDENSNGKTEAHGYWTRDIVALNSDTKYPHRAWNVLRNGRLNNSSVSNDIYSGIRPVITVLKSNLY